MQIIIINVLNYTFVYASMLNKDKIDCNYCKMLLQIAGNAIQE